MPIGSTVEIAPAPMPKAWHAARRPCSLDVAARLGKPITSPVA